MREQLRELTKQYEKSENDLKALQSVGQVRSQQICYSFIISAVNELDICISYGLVDSLFF